MTIVAPDEILRFILVDFSRILHLQEIRRWISEKSTTITSTPLPYVDLLDTFWLKMCWKLKLCAMGGVASLWLLLGISVGHSQTPGGRPAIPTPGLASVQDCVLKLQL